MFKEILKNKMVLFKPDLESLRLFEPEQEEMFWECYICINLWVGDLENEPTSLSAA